MTPPTSLPQLNWQKDDIEQDKSLTFIDWDALTRYAINARRQVDGAECSCQLSAEYNMGGLHVVRRIEFDDSIQWLARLQLEPPTPESRRRLQNEVHTMAAAEMASVRFSKIGTIVVRDGEFGVGPIRWIGGPFNTAAEYFEAWAKTAKFPYNEAIIRPRTPADVVDGILSEIRSFPSQVQQLAGRFPFREGPFPLIHTDLYCSNIIIDTDYNVLSVIDWENALVGPWELVEFNKQLSIVPPAMDGPLFKETEQRKAMELARAEYVKLVQTQKENSILTQRCLPCYRMNAFEPLPMHSGCMVKGA